MVTFLSDRAPKSILRPSIQMHIKRGSNFTCLTPRWGQRRLPVECMDDVGNIKIIELAESLARRRGSALDR